MTHTILIRSRGTRDRYFEVDGDARHRINSGARFCAICRLESALALLGQAARMPECSVVEREADLTSVDCKPGRKRVRYLGCLEGPGVRDLLSGVVAAKMVDGNPRDQHRADLSGRLCELEH